MAVSWINIDQTGPLARGRAVVRDCIAQALGRRGHPSTTLHVFGAARQGVADAGAVAAWAASGAKGARATRAPLSHRLSRTWHSLRSCGPMNPIFGARTAASAGRARRRLARRATSLAGRRDGTAGSPRACTRTARASSAMRAAWKRSRLRSCARAACPVERALCALARASRRRCAPRCTHVARRVANCCLSAWCSRSTEAARSRRGLAPPARSPASRSPAALRHLAEFRRAIPPLQHLASSDAASRSALRD